MINSIERKNPSRYQYYVLCVCVTFYVRVYTGWNGRELERKEYTIWRQDEVSRDEWARNKLHTLNVPNWGESFVWSLAVWQLFLPFSPAPPLSPSLSLSLLIHFFFVYPCNCTTNNRERAASGDWQASMTVVYLPRCVGSVSSSRVIQ